MQLGHSCAMRRHVRDWAFGPPAVMIIRDKLTILTATATVSNPRWKRVTGSTRVSLTMVGTCESTDAQLTEEVQDNSLLDILSTEVLIEVFDWLPYLQLVLCRRVRECHIPCLEVLC